MDTFQITVLIVAAILLIAIFTTIGILTKYSTFDKAYPPIANTCPDYWSVDSDTGYCTIPTDSSKPNVGTVYSGSAITLTSEKADKSKIYTPGYGSGVINFNDSLWGSIGKTTLCAKKNWATKNNIAWDGVSNYNSCE
jgi:hypothetical protein